MIKAHAALLCAGIATFVLMGAGQALYGPALPALSRAFALPVADAGILVSAHWVGCAIGVACMFFLGARITPRHTLALMAAGAAGVALGHGWWSTILGAVVFGTGYGCATVVFNPRVLRAFGARGTAMLSLLNATFGLGAIAAPLAFVALGNDPFMAFGLLCGGAIFIWLWAGPAGKSGAAPRSATHVPFRPAWPILAFGAFAIATEACLIGLGPTALIAAGETETRAAQLLSAFFLAFLGSRVALIFAAHLLRPFTLFTLAVGGVGLCAAGAALIDPAPFFVISGAFTGLMFPGFYVTASARMGEDPRVPPTIIAAGLAGGIFAPILLAPWLEALGRFGFFWLIAATTLGLALVALAALRRMNSAA